MRLAGPGGGEEQHRVPVRNPAADRQVTELAWVQGRLGLKVKAVELPHERELRELAGHADAACVPSGDRTFDEERQRLP